MSNHVESNKCIRVVDRYRDLPEGIKNFGKKPFSEHSSPDKGLEGAPLPLNKIGEKMFVFDNESELEYTTIVSPPVDEDDRRQKLAQIAINKLSKTGLIYRYDLPDGTICYISFAS